VSSPPGSRSNQPVEVMNRWQQVGDRTDIQRFTQSGATTAYLAYIYAQVFSSDFTVGDASFVRLKNVSLSYRLPPSWLGKTPLDGITLYVRGHNLLTLTDYIGRDPENQSLLALPPLKTVVAGIQFSL